jgi:hypothetical protein
MDYQDCYQPATVRAAIPANRPISTINDMTLGHDHRGYYLSSGSVRTQIQWQVDGKWIDVDEFTIPDGSWAVDIEQSEADPGCVTVYWLYPFTPRVHCWYCYNGLRKKTADLDSAESESFFRARFEKSTLITAKLIQLLYQKVDRNAAVSMARDCAEKLIPTSNIQCLHVILSIAHHDLALSKSVEIHSEQIRDLISNLNWSEFDFTNQPSMRRVLPFIEAVTTIAIAKSLHIDENMKRLLRMFLDSVRNFSGIRNFSFNYSAKNSSIKIISRKSQNINHRLANTPGLNLSRAIFSGFSPQGPSLYIFDDILLEQSRITWSLLYLHTLMNDFILKDGRSLPLSSTFTEDTWLLAQVGDTPIDVPSVAFQSKPTYGNVTLIPDVYFFNSHGYQPFRSLVQKSYEPWGNRATSFCWRGSTTGSIDVDENSLSDLPRVRLCRISRDIGRHMDVKINQVVQGKGTAKHAAMTKRLVEHGLLGNSIPQIAFMKHKFQIDIDGNANSWGLFNKLLMGSCILKVESDWLQWYYPDLKPWQHYIPVKGDLSDFPTLVEWCLGHDHEAQLIALRGQEFASRLTYSVEMSRAANNFYNRLTTSGPPLKPS